MWFERLTLTRAFAGELEQENFKAGRHSAGYKQLPTPEADLTYQLTEPTPLSDSEEAIYPIMSVKYVARDFLRDADDHRRDPPNTAEPNHASGNLDFDPGRRLDKGTEALLHL